jgi:hypothetical protein
MLVVGCSPESGGEPQNDAGALIDAAGPSVADAAPDAVADAAPTTDAAPTADAASADASLVPVRVRIEALIDGRSRLILRRDQARWHHVDFAAPGRHEGANAPTLVNGQPWLPSWPDLPDAENRSCDCESDTLAGLVPEIPARAQTVRLNPLGVRGKAAIVEQPSEANDFALVVELDDRDVAGSATYAVELELFGVFP